MTHEISQVIANGNFNRVSYRVASEVTITSFCRGYEALGSRTSMLNEIKQALKDPEMYMIGVHGMGGVGKTTLVNELAWQVKKDGSFGSVVIATITHSPDIENIQDQIADALDGKLEKKTKRGRAGELRQRIRLEKSVLIILDDIWSELNLTEVGIPFGDEHNGCKLVVTSRDLNVLTKMETQREFDLRVLLEEESWNLFQEVAGDVAKQFNIKPIAEKVARCCAGLPLLIVTVAKGLRKKDVIVWKDALFQLQGFAHEELEKKVNPTLKLSYDYLENDELKSLFLFIGSSGLNDIHTRNLFFYCWGLGLYDRMRTLTDARNRHHRLCNDLIASSLLLEVEPELVRMHDVVRTMAKSLAPSIHSIILNNAPKWPMVDQLKTCHYLFIPGASIGQLPERLDCPELNLLLLRNLRGMLKVPDIFFSGMRDVRILDLCGMELTPSLPSSLDLLINLRSLNLFGCNLGDIRMVGKLKLLQILSLENTSIKELPIEIGHLTDLRMLNVTNCFLLEVIPANLISSLKCLEELYMENCNIRWEVEGSKSESNNASLGELRNLHQLKTLEMSIPDASVLPRQFQFLSSLERYNIILGRKWEWSSLEHWFRGAHETSRTLKITDSWWSSISLTTVEDLGFAKLKSVEDVLYELNKQGCPELKHLFIKDSHELLHVINSKGLVNPHSAFPNLETLVLYNLNKMKGICHGPLSTQCFAKLKAIKVVGCHKLENLLSYSLVRNLSQLHVMEIYNCDDMTEIIAKEKQEDEKEIPKIVLPELHYLTLRELPMLLSFYLPLTVDKGNPSIESIPLALFNQQVVMPKLETLTLDKINTCKIWDDKLRIPVLSCIQNLTTLKIFGCGRLTSLFSSWVARALVKLQRLDICDCSMLKEIFVREEEEVEFPNLETLIINNLHDLKSIWPNQLALNSFCKLKRICIQRCESLDYVFPISVAMELRFLQFLEVINCAMENLVERSDSCDMTLVYVENLRVSGCQNMKTIVPSSVLFRNLDQLQVDYCNGVVNIITPSTTTCLPKLRILSIENCGMLEEIYGSRNEGDAPLGEIAFTKLEELTLKGLPRLTSFCQGNYDFKFQSLERVFMDECPMMETFCHGNLTTPNHTKVFYDSEEAHCHWDGDLNTNIRTIFTKKNSIQDMSSSSKNEED